MLTAIVLGALFRRFFPETGVDMKRLGDGFIRLIIASIIFWTVVTDVADREDMKKVGRVGAKLLIYLEIVSTLPPAIGMVVVGLIRPGAGMNADVSKLDTRVLGTFTQKTQSHNSVGFLMNIVPNTVVEVFTKGDILRVPFGPEPDSAHYGVVGDFKVAHYPLWKSVDISGL